MAAATVQTNSVSNINPSLSKVFFSIISNGGDAITEMGIVYGTSINPTTSDTKVIIPLSGANGDFYMYVKNLLANTAYHCRAYAINASGTSYGSNVSFTAQSATAPTVFSYAAMGVNATGATKLHGNIAINGGQAITERGFVVSESANPITSDTKVVVAGELGNFYGTVSGLTANTVYHYRTFATNATGTAYGNDMVFKTKRDTGRRSLPDVPDNFGITVSSDTNNGGPVEAIDRAIVTNDIAYFKSIGMKHVRFACTKWFNGAITAPRGADTYWQDHYSFARQSAIDYVQAGITVHYNLLYGEPINPSATNMNNFTLWLIDEMYYAQANGVTTIQIENEVDYKRSAGVTQTDMYNWQQKLCLLAVAVGFTGEKTYGDYWDGIPAWRTNGLGNFDSLGLQHYNPSSLTPSYATGHYYNRAAIDVFGAENLYLSEWSIDNHNYQWDFSAPSPGTGVTPNPAWTEKTLKKWISAYNQNRKLLFPDHVSYYYCWKNRHDGPLNALSASDMSGVKRLFWYNILERREYS